jgi:hypothetical protein
MTDMVGSLVQNGYRESDEHERINVVSSPHVEIRGYISIYLVMWRFLELFIMSVLLTCCRLYTGSPSLVAAACPFHDLGHLLRRLFDLRRRHHEPLP